MTACDENRMELGVYALGALEPEDAERVAEHLAHCESCRKELEQLSSAAELLRSPQAGVLATGAEDVPAAEDALAAVAHERARERRRARRSTVAAGTGATLLATVVALSLAALPVFDSSGPVGAPAPLVPATGVEASATVRLSPKPWGTQVDLVTERMPALPPGAYYVLWLVRADGSRVAAGSFRTVKPTGKTRVRLAGSVPLVEVVRIGVTREGRGGSAPVLSTDHA